MTVACSQLASVLVSSKSESQNSPECQQVTTNVNGFHYVTLCCLAFTVTLKKKKMAVLHCHDSKQIFCIPSQAISLMCFDVLKTFKSNTTILTTKIQPVICSANKVPESAVCVGPSFNKCISMAQFGF